MKQRLICCSFATKDGYNGSANMGDKTDLTETYIINACVCCFSAKMNNPDCNVAFIHNLQTVPEKYEKFLKEHDILLIYVPYDKYTLHSNTINIL